MVSGSWFPVHRPCGSPLGMRLEQSFIQIVANGSSEPTSTNAAQRLNLRDKRQAAVG